MEKGGGRDRLPEYRLKGAKIGTKAEEGKKMSYWKKMIEIGKKIKELGTESSRKLSEAVLQNRQRWVTYWQQKQQELHQKMNQ